MTAPTTYRDPRIGQSGTKAKANHQLTPWPTPRGHPGSHCPAPLLLRTASSPLSPSGGAPRVKRTRRPPAGSRAGPSGSPRGAARDLIRSMCGTRVSLCGSFRPAPGQGGHDPRHCVEPSPGPGTDDGLRHNDSGHPGPAAPCGERRGWGPKPGEGGGGAGSGPGPPALSPARGRGRDGRTGPRQPPPRPLTWAPPDARASAPSPEPRAPGAWRPPLPAPRSLRPAPRAA